MASTIATANVEMNAVISKSTPLRPISGRTATCWISTPNTNVTAAAATRPITGPQPKPLNSIHETYPPTTTIAPSAMFRVRSVP